ncbi:MAG: FAD-dependent oxidoreductase [Providencia heimbachae]|nr:FAD-dependent oxidoreductase [Providencia heimbachae]
MHNNTFNPLRVEPPKKALNIRKIEFVEIYEPLNAIEVQSQAKRCLSCGSPYCEWKCPVHNPIPMWLKLAAEGRIIEAAELSHQTNSLPEVCGRVCPQDKLCEAACVLHDDFGAVTIGYVERYINDAALELGWRPDLSHVKYTTKRVAIIGAGPAGLACADVLARNGIHATVFDRHPEIGGLLTFGIPEFKLEKQVMTRRREIFSSMGINFQLNIEIGRDIHLDSLINGYDAIFIGTGSCQSISGQLPNESIQGVYEALPYLIANTRQRMGYHQTPLQPYLNLQDKRVLVLGGGDTAMDCVRSAIRQGAQQVTCAYRRDKNSMPGSPREVANAQEEGAQFYFNLQATQIEADQLNHVHGVTFNHTHKNVKHFIAADVVIIAFGFHPHALPWLENYQVKLDDKGRIQANRDTDLPYQTSNPKIFAGGDAVRGSDLVVTAIADGRNAAEGIMLYLGV